MSAGRNWPARARSARSSAWRQFRQGLAIRSRNHRGTTPSFTAMATPMLISALSRIPVPSSSHSSADAFPARAPRPQSVDPCAEAHVSFALDRRTAFLASRQARRRRLPAPEKNVARSSSFAWCARPSGARWLRGSVAEPRRRWRVEAGGALTSARISSARISPSRPSRARVRDRCRALSPGGAPSAKLCRLPRGQPPPRHLRVLPAWARKRSVPCRPVANLGFGRGLFARLHDPRDGLADGNDVAFGALTPARIPSAGDSISTTALSVSTSSSGSPLATRSPSFFRQAISLPLSCAISSAGITMLWPWCLGAAETAPLFGDSDALRSGAGFDHLDHALARRGFGLARGCQRSIDA